MNMKKEVSLRELILLGVLIIIAAYYFLVSIPVTDELQEIETNTVVTNGEITAFEEKLVRQTEMEKEIEKAAEAAGGKPVPIPDYDNANNIITELHVILDARDIPYNVNFNRDNPESFVIRRDIAINFTAHDYDEAMSILKELKASPNRYSIDDIRITDSTGIDGNNNCTVAMNIFCYEYTGEAE